MLPAKHDESPVLLGKRKSVATVDRAARYSPQTTVEVSGQFWGPRRFSHHVAHNINRYTFRCAHIKPDRTRTPLAGFVPAQSLLWRGTPPSLSACCCHSSSVLRFWGLWAVAMEEQRCPGHGFKAARCARGANAPDRSEGRAVRTGGPTGEAGEDPTAGDPDSPSCRGLRARGQRRRRGKLRRSHSVRAPPA